MDDRRANLGGREDRRVRRTRALLEQGLVRLLEEKPLRAITVRELTDLVDINRGTFYLYYRDIYDMVDKLEADYYARFNEVLGRHDGRPMDQRLHLVLNEMFSFMEENRQLIRVLLGEHGDMDFLQKISQDLKERCRQNLSPAVHISAAEFEYRYSFASLGILGIVRSWLAEDCRVPARKMAALTERCVVCGVLPRQAKQAGPAAP